ncbi:MAG: oligosaccharide flippase family protein [candidate division WOR-3 bacterium]|nr:oligosaccharide flippase family protein [candidate division WOR-3 bacterium]MDW8113476.1 oligosaccharide flippase family protein [candidate division WOR-3 bacterium]
MLKIERWEELRKIFFQSFQYFLSLIIVRSITAINGIFLARFLLSEKFGIFSNINQLAILLTFFASFGLPSAITKFIAQAKENKELLNETFNTAQILIFLTSAIVIIIYFFLCPFLANRIYNKPFLIKYLYFIIFLLLFLTLNNFWIGILQGLKIIKSISLINILYNLISLPLIFFLVRKYEISGGIWAFTIANFFGSLLFFFTIKKYFSLNLNFQKNIAKNILSLTFPTFLSGLVMMPAMWLVTTRLGVTKNFSEVAYFNIANTFFQFLLFMPLAIGMPLTPTIAENIKNQEKIKELLNKIMNYLNIFLFILLLPFLIFSSKIITLLYGNHYLSAVKPFIFVVSAIIPTSIGYILGYYLLGTGKMWLATLFNGVWFVLFVGSTFFFTYKFGALGAGISFYIAYLCQAFLMIFYLKNILIKPFRLLQNLILISFLVIIFYKLI